MLDVSVSGGLFEHGVADRGQVGVDAFEVAQGFEVECAGFHGVGFVGGEAGEVVAGGGAFGFGEAAFGVDEFAGAARVFGHEGGEGEVEVVEDLGVEGDEVGLVGGGEAELAF